MFLNIYPQNFKIDNRLLQLLLTIESLLKTSFL